MMGIYGKSSQAVMAKVQRIRLGEEGIRKRAGD